MQKHYPALAMIVILALGFIHPVNAQKSNATDSENIVWPPPPETPRIRYIGELTSQKSLGKKASLGNRIKHFFLGGGDDKSITVKRPIASFVDSLGVMYVSNGAGGIISVFDQTEREARIISPTGPGALAKPMGMTGDSDGHIYVADPVQRRVVKLDTDGNFIQAYGGRKILLNPVDVAVSKDGSRVYVADSYLHQVVIFDEHGTLLKRVGRNLGDIESKDTVKATATHQTSGAGNHDGSNSSDIVENRGAEAGEFRYPSFLAVGPEGNVFVSDAMNFRIQILDFKGEFVSQFGRIGDTPGSFARPKGVAVDSDGHIYVVDAAFNNVQIFDREGGLLLAFGGLGPGPGRLWLPLGISIDETGQIVVSDRANNRIQRYQYLSDPEPTSGLNMPDSDLTN